MSSSSPTQRPADEPHGWPRAAQVAFAFLLGFVTAVLIERFIPLLHRSKPTVPAVASGLDLNRANKAELMQLPQMGEKRADQVIATRDRLGGFKSTDDLKAVKGLGPSRREEISPFVRAGSDEQFVRSDASSQESAAGKSASTRRGKKEPPAEPVDVNRASVAELMQLPGIGKIIAERIVAERQKSPFRTIEDLDRRVTGIGPKTLEKIRDLVRIDLGDLDVPQE